MISQTAMLPSAMPLLRVPGGPEQLYAETDAFITDGSRMLAQDPDRWAPVLEALSSTVKDDFRSQLHALERVPALAETCRDAALQALQAGLMAGAIDGMLLFVLHQDRALEASPVVRPAAGVEGLPDREQLERRLDEILAGAATGLRDVGVWAVQSASTLSKTTGSEAVEQARAIPDVGLPRPAYQAFLLTCFTTGYAAAGLDSALIVGAGQQP